MAVKQVVVIRKDLKMRRGKECAQVAHASSYWMMEKLRKCYEQDKAPAMTDACWKWISDGKFKKIVLQVDSEEQLDEIHRLCVERDLIVHLIVDSGLTEFNGVPTKTCLAIGPDQEEDIDAITGPKGKFPLKTY